MDRANHGKYRYGSHPIDKSTVNNNSNNNVAIKIERSKNSCCTPECPCETKELIRNGGFEILSTDLNQVFADWQQINANGAEVGLPPVASVPYEGLFQAVFSSGGTTTEQMKSVSLRQTVTVNTGCIYRLSFAENFLQRGINALSSSRFTGRVFYTKGGREFDLINIPIAKIDDDSDVDKGYTFHQKTAEIPVPCEVNSVIVQFDFQVKDMGGTFWLLDGVSLRAVSSSPAYCQDSDRGAICTRGIGQLVKNGGFEMPGIIPDQTFRSWQAKNTTHAAVDSASPIVYEGLNAARFSTVVTTPIAFSKTTSIRQAVTVIPGCQLELSFAENFLSRGNGAGDTPRLIARVFYVDSRDNEFDLINVSIAKIDDASDADKGYTFHKKTADIPIPSNVSSVYVQFDFFVSDLVNTAWLLDGVSLRSIFPSSACCNMKDECQETKNGRDPICSCERRELVRNGGFEILSPNSPSQTFENWTVVNQNAAVVNNSINVVYEGLSAASFSSNFIDFPSSQSVSLRQAITATPGCIYRLSFAENFFSRSPNSGNTPRLIGRVFYVDKGGNEVDLINVAIARIDEGADADKGYTYHEKTADVPVPCDVSELIVQFDYLVTDDLGKTIWLLDGVSLRAVFSSSACCENKC